MHDDIHWRVLPPTGGNRSQRRSQHTMAWSKRKGRNTQRSWEIPRITRILKGKKNGNQCGGRLLMLSDFQVGY